MNIVIIQFILWICLLIFFWVLKDTLGRVEGAIDADSSSGQGQSALCRKTTCFARPENVMDPIGNYQGMTIYRYVLIEGKRYQFDYVWPAAEPPPVQERQRCIAPGLIYLQC